MAARALPATDAVPPGDRTDVVGAQEALAAGLVPAVVLLLAGLVWVVSGRGPGAQGARGLAVGAALLAGALTLNPWWSAATPEVPPPTPLGRLTGRARGGALDRRTRRAS